MKYIVTITETLTRDAKIEAENPDKAKDIIEAEWYGGKYILGSGDFVNVGFGIKETEE